MKHVNNSTHTIKTANNYLVIDAVRKGGSVTIEDIVRSTHLSRPTVLGIMEELQQRKLIEQIGYAKSQVGRQPVLYAMSASTYFSIGIDFEFPPIHLIAVDLSGTVRYEKNWDCSFEMEKDKITSLLVGNIQEAMAALGITCEQLMGIGLGIPGTVNRRENTSEVISRIPEWNKTPLSEILRSYFPVPVYVRNDAHLMAFAAQARLALGQDLMYIAYRTGIGMAIIRNGRLWEGVFGNSGYIGHTTVDIDGDLCSCGKRGCLETFASKPTIEYKYAQAKNLDVRVSFDTILELAKKGDSIAIDMLKQAGKYFGIALANSVKLLDIHTILLDDLNCDADHVFIRSIEDTINDYCSSYAPYPIEVIPHPIKKSEYALGAALFVLETFFKKPRLKLSVEDD